MRAVVGGARGEHPLARAALPAWYGEAEMLTTSSAPASAWASRAARVPDVLADVTPSADAAAHEHRVRRPGWK